MSTPFKPTPRAVLDAARNFARASRDVVLAQIRIQHPTAVVDTPFVESYMDLVQDCYLTGAAEMLKLLHGDTEPEPWRDHYRHESRLEALFSIHCVGALPQHPTAYCACWADPYAPGAPMYYEHWYGIADIQVTLPEPEDMPYLRCVCNTAHLVLCFSCGRVAPWRGEPVGQCTLTAAAACVKRFYRTDGRRREEPLHA